jgi:flagellar hook protein FlgE
VNSEGFLVTSGGQYVQGWTGVSNGQVNTNGVLGDIQVPTGTLSQPVATSSFSIDANLNSSNTPVVALSANGTSTGGVTLTSSNDTLSLGINGAGAQQFTLNTSDATITDVANDLQAQFTTAGINATASLSSTGGLQITSTLSTPSAGVQVFNGSANSPLGLTVTSTSQTTANTFSYGGLQAVDSLGNQVPVTLTFTKDTTNGTWTYAISSTEGQVSGGTGTIQFNNAGVMTGISSPTMSADGKSDTVNIANLPDGAADLSMSWSFYNTDGSPRFTQYSETSGVSANTQNGQQASELTSVSLGAGGEVLASYSAGPQQVVGMLAMATVRNPTSLLGTTDNNLEIGADTATPAVGTAGTGGRGTLEGGALESSTVDIATEFSQLLTYERSYQANSRVITVSDDISQETVNLIK